MELKRRVVQVCLVAAMVTATGSASAEATGTGFTYQGQLKQGGVPVRDTCDFDVGLWTAEAGGTELGMQVVQTDVENGLFTLKLNEAGQFGADAFNGEARYLAIEVSCPPGSPFVPLGRQELTPGPYALFALNGSDGSGGAWLVAGNASTNPGTNFLGTTDDQPLELHVNGVRALRLEPNATSPNVIAGHPANRVDQGVHGATISGGGADGSIVGIASRNTITSFVRFGTIGGGIGNEVNGESGTIGGGARNVAASQCTVGGGQNNHAISDLSTVAGGNFNTADATRATIGGGNSNTATGSFSTISGGANNISSESYTTVGGGKTCKATGEYATVGGGEFNNASGRNATIGGGLLNAASGLRATVAGGSSHDASGTRAAIGGGGSNTASGVSSTVPGGSVNQAGGDYSFAAGRRAKVRDATAAGNTTGDQGTFIWADSTNADWQSTGPDQFLIRATGGVGIGTNSPATPLHIDGGTDASLSGGGILVLGDTAATNLVLAANEIMARDNGGVRTLGFQNDGGDVVIHSLRPEAERIRFKSNGRVGIGTDSPTAELHVVRDGAPVVLTEGYSASGVFVGQRATGPRADPSPTLANKLLAVFGGTGYSESGFADKLRSRGRMNIISSEDWTDTAQGTRISFSTTEDGTTTQVERMHISADGHVGIGTSEPDKLLQVRGTGDSGAFTHTDWQAEFGKGGAGRVVVGSYEDQPAIQGHGTGTSFRLLLNPTGGNVGIGTTSPQSQLDVRSSADDSAGRIVVGNKNQDTWLQLWSGGSKGTNEPALIWAQGTDLRFGTGDVDGSPYSESMRILSNGNVGIGTTDPGASLEVKGNSSLNVPQLKLTESAADFARLTFANTENARFWTIAGLTENEPIDGFAEDNLNFFHSTAGNGLSIHVGSVGMAWVGIGTTNPQARLDVRGRTRTDVLQITGGSDLSEQFDIASGTHEAKPGTVVCIDPTNPGQLAVCNSAYDRTVAGVISGAGGVKPGMLMGQRGSVADGEYPVALTGRVYVWVDASNGPIQPGDLLTTSDSPGHAMKVLDYGKAQGAIIGKAMTPLNEGKGLVLVLVTLQ